MNCFFENDALVREKVFFGFDWLFAKTDNTDFPKDGDEWRSVQLPHDWSVDYPIDESSPACGSGGYAVTGIGWYKRGFRARVCEGSKYALHFDGVYMNCDVWLNGTHVAKHVYGYTGFEADITSVIKNGENTILVRVDNSRQPGSRWYTGSGITRNVYLVKTGNTHIDTWGVYAFCKTVSKALAEVCVQTTVVNADESGLSLETRILFDGNVCGQNTVIGIESGVLTQDIEIANPNLWDVETPNLYRVHTIIKKGEKVIDEMHTPFGIRQIAFDSNNGFMLNGRKLLLNGVCLHHDGGCVGAAVPPAIWKRRLEKLNEMGANAIRFSHNPPDPELIDMADEMGFCVMDEAFDEWRAMKQKVYGSNTHESRGYSEWFDLCHEDDLKAMLRRDRNHPSIVMWSIGNEVPEQIIPGGHTIAQRLISIVRSLDTTRPITQACDQVKAQPTPAYTEFLESLDIVGVNYTDRWRDRSETYFDEEKIEHPNWLLLGTEDVSVGGERGDYRLVTEESVWGRTPYYARALKAEKLWKYVRTRPFVIGDFMWTGVDYLGESDWPGKNSTSGVLDTCGFAKDGYYLYQSLWRNDIPVLHVFPNLDIPLEKGDIYPVLAYTNCFTAELLVDGKSYGVKAYEFPSQGMTQSWGHFDRRLSPITTNDLHLQWDVPFTGGELVCIGRDENGNEIARQVIRPTGKAVKLQAKADKTALKADGRDVMQIEIALIDSEGQVCASDDREVRISVKGGRLLGMDNGKSTDHEPYKSGKRTTHKGLLFAVIQALDISGEVEVTLACNGFKEEKIVLTAE